MCYIAVGVELHCGVLYEMVMTLRTALYWFIMQYVVVIYSGQTIYPKLKSQISCLVPLFTHRRTASLDFLVLKNETNIFSRTVSNKLPLFPV